MDAPRNVRRIARVLTLGVLAIAFVTTDARYIGTACAIDKNTGKPTDPSTRGGKLPPPRTGGQAGGCTQSYCEGVMKELGWKCTSVEPSLSGGYCECQCKDQNGAVVGSKKTSAQHQPAGTGGGYKP